MFISVTIYIKLAIIEYLDENKAWPTTVTKKWSTQTGTGAYSYVIIND